MYFFFKEKHKTYNFVLRLTFLRNNIFVLTSFYQKLIKNLYI